MLNTEIFVFTSSLGDSILFGTLDDVKTDLCNHHEIESLPEDSDLEEITEMPELIAQADNIWEAARQLGNADVLLDLEFTFLGGLESVSLNECDESLEDCEIHFQAVSDDEVTVITVDGVIFLHNDVGSVRIGS